MTAVRHPATARLPGIRTPEDAAVPPGAAQECAGKNTGMLEVDPHQHNGAQYATRPLLAGCQGRAWISATPSLAQIRAR